MAELLASPEKINIDLNQVGHPEAIAANPAKALVAIINHRLEVGILDIEAGTVRLFHL